MTIGGAFHGDPAVRDAALERLDDCIARDAIQQRRLFWDGTSGSPLGCLLHSQDLAAWTDQLNLPLALAMPAEFLATNDTVGVQRLKALIDDIAPGADAFGLAGEMVIWLLDDVIAGISDDPVAADLVATASELRGMQTAVLAGGGPSPQAWRAVRRQAMAQVEAAEESPILVAAGRAIEAAAWDAGTASSALYDTLEAWLNWQLQRAGCPTPAEFSIMNDLLDQVDPAFFGTEGLEREALRLIESAHPELHAKIMDFKARGGAVNLSLIDRVNDAMIAMARALPVPLATVS